jgi:GDP-mannose 6-dehydrogenase
VFGLGHVGVVACAGLADLGHHVVGVDSVAERVQAINAGHCPIAEPRLPTLLRRVVEGGRLRATTDAAAAIRGSDLALVCVGTSADLAGRMRLADILSVCRQVGTALRGDPRAFFTVLVRSTCLPAVHRRLQEILQDRSGRAIGQRLGYVCHPEFLREGQAVADFYRPPRIVFGTSDARSAAVCRALYPRGVETPALFASVEVAAMIKYADNGFHATKVTFANEIGLLCHSAGVDARVVMDAVSRDRKLNLSRAYLRPGAAFGGSCLPKDMRVAVAGVRASVPMLTGVLRSNRAQLRALVARVRRMPGRAVALVGLAFKEGTDDLRESPMLTLASHLARLGRPLRIYDARFPPTGEARRRLPSGLRDSLALDLRSAVEGAAAVVVGHRLTPAAWGAVSWRKRQRVLDLVDVPALRRAPGYEGLYW